MRTWSARVPLAVGFSAVALFFGGLGAWSVGTEIAGAVVARGTVEVESERQVVQHPDGGVVGEILARDGDNVTAGAVLVRLDGTFLRSELAIVERQLAEIHARRARLVAERDGAERLETGRPPDFALVEAETVAEQVKGQASLFEARRVSLEQERRQLGEQQAQILRQIEGIEAQLAASRRQLGLVGEELGNVRALFDQGLVPAPRLLDLQRQEAHLEGEAGRLVAAVAEARTRVSQLGIEAIRLVETRREEAISGLGDLEYTAIELEQRRLSLAERLSRLDVRAPADGVVFGSRIFAVQSVVRAAEPMMYIVPGDRPLLVSARIDPVDIDQVHAGQDVSLVLPAFNRRTTPELPGTVLRVSADVALDEATGERFYEAVIAPDPAALSALPEISLLPGMPVETFLRTGDRTPLSYLVQPLAAYFNRAFREE